MLISIAFKNIWRNKLRSLIVIFAVMIGLFAGSFAISIIEGVTKARTYSVIHNEISHIQIHNPKFEKNKEAKYYIENTSEIINFIKKQKEVVAFSKRLILFPEIKTSRASTGGFVYGINPEQERKLTKIYTKLVDSAGTYFETNRKNQILISEKTAKKLKIERYKLTKQGFKKLLAYNFPKDDTTFLKTLINKEFRTKKKFFDALRKGIDKVVIDNFEYLIVKYSILFRDNSKITIVFRDKDENQVAERFWVAGIYKTSNIMFDEMTLFVKSSELEKMIGFQKGQAHEIAILLSDKFQAKEFAKKIKTKFPDVNVETWGEISPELIMISEYMTIYNYFIIVLILSALAFGIVNTMLMAIMERTKELGMLAAIGMNRKRIFNMIMIETIFLTSIGALVGLAVNYLTISYLSVVGIDFSKQVGEAFEAIGYDSVIYPQMSFNYYIGITLLVFVAAVLSSIYPAIKAIKLNPAEAVRTDA